MRYNLRSFTDTNSVICKIIVGAGAHDSPSYDDGNVIAGRRGRRPLQMRKGDRNSKGRPMAAPTMYMREGEPLVIYTAFRR